MATYYFDANGATAGFSTLTGNWNPSTALWSTSSAGTAATAAVTFTNADVAQFGFAGTTGTAGTATITTGITNTVNQVVTANLAGAQTIAGPGTLDLAGTTPTVNVGSAGGLTISAPITGTAGFTKSGAGTLTVSSVSSGLSGVVTISQGAVFSGSNSAPMTTQSMPSVSEWIVNAERYLWNGSVASYTIPKVSGSGIFWVSNNNAATAAANSLVIDDLTGLSNLRLTFTQLTGSQRAFVAVKQFPSTPWALAFAYTGSNIASATATIAALTVPTDATASVTPASIDLAGAYSGAVTVVAGSSWTGTIYANQSTGAMEFSGNANRSASSVPYPTATFQLAGTSTADNKFSGVISDDATRTIALAKAEAGRWILSGANTYRGATTISAGTLAVQNSSGLGSASGGAVSVANNATLELSGSGDLAINKSSATLTLTGTGDGGNGALRSVSGNNFYTASGYTLTAGSTVRVEAGSVLTMGGAGATIGSASLTKVGSGELALPQTASTYTGQTIISAGKLSVVALANLSSSSSIGQPTTVANGTIAMDGADSVLSFYGATVGKNETNRAFSFGAACTAPTFEAVSSSLPMLLTPSSITHSAGVARTLTFVGTSTFDNTFNADINNNGASLVSIAKSGAGKWVLSGAALNYTGTTTVSDGTLGLGNAARTLSGAVSISGGTIENGTSTLSANVTMTGGTITAELTGNNTLDVNLGDSATLQPVNNANTYTGATTVATGGILRLITGENPTLGGGKVLGDSNVSVTGNLKTFASVTQKGQMRYGGNLTFNSGAKLYVGGA